jgi:hypothetical protein
MHAVTVLIKKLDTVSTRDFRDWWVNHHVPYSLKLLNVDRYLILQPDDYIDRATGNWSTPVPFDGIAVFYFDDADAITKAMSYPKTPEHRAEVDAWIETTVVMSGAALTGETGSQQ